jgi:hypothetical protein
VSVSQLLHLDRCFYRKPPESSYQRRFAQLSLSLAVNWLRLPPNGTVEAALSALADPSQAGRIGLINFMHDGGTSFLQTNLFAYLNVSEPE